MRDRRNDSATIAADRLELARLILEGQNSSYEELPASDQSLSFQILEEKLNRLCGLFFFLGLWYYLRVMVEKGHRGLSFDPSNKASSRTCELAGGRYVETATVPEWHNMYDEGKRLVMVYQFNLEETSD